MRMEKLIEYPFSSDTNGQPLEGNKIYRLHLPPNIPSEDFWSVIVYDNLTRLIIKTDQPWPSVHSKCASLMLNQNGSVDIWFGPEPSEEKELNWIKTIPGRKWNLILRLYNPLETGLNKIWQPGGMVKVVEGHEEMLNI